MTFWDDDGMGNGSFFFLDLSGWRYSIEQGKHIGYSPCIITKNKTIPIACSYVTVEVRQKWTLRLMFIWHLSRNAPVAPRLASEEMFIYNNLMFHHNTVLGQSD